MGHTRLGTVPQTRKWKHVVDVFVEEVLDIANQAAKEEAIPQISETTLEAAKKGVDEAINDKGLIYTYYLLTQLALAGKKGDWEKRLNKIGLFVNEETSTLEIVAQLQGQIDSFLNQSQYTSDISEIALQSVGDAINKEFNSVTPSLFQENKSNIQRALKKISTKRGFSKLGRAFFAQFMTRFLNFYLSRISASKANTNFAALEISKFNKQLNEHCYQSSYIVEDFCGEWYKKTEWNTGIDFENTSRFLAVALKKIKAELELREQGE